jgi:hypothetical protein
MKNKPYLRQQSKTFANVNLLAALDSLTKKAYQQFIM